LTQRAQRGRTEFTEIRGDEELLRLSPARAEARASFLRVGGGVPHFLLDFPLAGGVFVEDEEEFAIALHCGLVGRLQALRFEAPFGGPIAGDLDVVEVDFFANNFVAGHLGGDVVDEFADGGAADHGRHAGKEADTVVGPHGDDGGVVHAEVRVDKFFVEGEDFGFRIGGSGGLRGKEKEECGEGQEGRTTRREHERTS
jgi:hypothetical protein